MATEEREWTRPAAGPVVVREITPAGEAVRPFVNPLRTAAHFWRLRRLIWQLAVRDLVGRYRGSFLGIFWSLLLPLLMLALYTFVFSVVFQTRWGAAGQGSGGVALMLFAGLVPFNAFSDLVSAAPMLVIGNPSYVKRVVFPLEILVPVKLLSVLFHSFISSAVLALGILAARGALPATILLMPVTWIPLLLLALGIGYVVAALSVFVRDVNQAVGILLPFLFFLTPIVYPLEAVPDRFRVFTWMNPIAHVVDDARRTAMLGLQPNWRGFGFNCALCGTITFAGFLMFMKSKRAFADAI